MNWKTNLSDFYGIYLTGETLLFLARNKQKINSTDFQMMIFLIETDVLLDSRQVLIWLNVESEIPSSPSIYKTVQQNTNTKKDTKFESRAFCFGKKLYFRLSIEIYFI